MSLEPDVRECKIPDPSRAEQPEANTRLKGRSRKVLKEPKAPRQTRHPKFINCKDTSDNTDVDPIYGTTEFIKLQRAWYKKLAETGFKDVERCHPTLGTATSGNTPLLRPSEWAPRLAESKPGTEEFFRVASHFLHEYNFETYLDKQIWELFTEGVSITDIHKKVTENPHHKVKRWYVDVAIKRHTTLMLAELKKDSNE